MKNWSKWTIADFLEALPELKRVKIKGKGPCISCQGKADMEKHRCEWEGTCPVCGGAFFATPNPKPLPGTHWLTLIYCKNCDPQSRTEEGSRAYKTIMNRLQERLEKMDAAKFNKNPVVIKNSFTPLHKAAMNNKNPAVITALVKEGADPNAQKGKYSRTPLHLAAQFNENPEIIIALLDAGADPRAKDMYDKTPWDYAKENGALKNTDAFWRLLNLRF